MSDESPGVRLTRRHALALGGAALGGVAIGNNVLAQADEEDGQGDGEARQYRVTVANLTQGQPFTPPAVVMHSPEIELFSVGDQANEAVQELAENGNLEPIVSLVTGGDGGGDGDTETPTETPAVGDNVTNGNATNGNVTNGNVTDGNATNGNVTDGNATNGNVTNGETDGNVTDGNATDDNATDGEAEPEPTEEEDTEEDGGVPDAIGGAAVGEVPLVPEEDPGGTGNPYFTTLEVEASADATHLSFASMLIATNDGFVGLDTVELPEETNASNTFYANGYDAGTEQNTEQFSDMVPGAQSLILGGGASGGTTESNPDIAETNVIRPHPGIEGTGDLAPETYDWEEPAALVQVERIDGEAPPEEPAEDGADGGPPDNATDGGPPEDEGPPDNATDGMDENATDDMDGNATDGMDENATDGMDGNATDAEEDEMGDNETEGNETG